MNRISCTSRVSSRLPQDVVAKVIADQSEQQRLDRACRWKQLLAHVRTSRADFERETQSRRRLLSSLDPPPPAGPLDAEIEAAWQRLYLDYRRYRKATPYPGEKGWR